MTLSCFLSVLFFFFLKKYFLFCSGGFSTSSAGITGLIRKAENDQKQADKTLSVAFADIDELMVKVHYYCCFLLFLFDTFLKTKTQ